jgi:hypothetical protein
MSWQRAVKAHGHGLQKVQGDKSHGEEESDKEEGAQGWP